jgi:hypothetical protein
VNVRKLLSFLGVAAALAGCGSGGTRATGSAGITATRPTARTTDASATVDGSAASCAGLSAKQQLAIARLVFVGRARPGPTAHVDGRDVVISPARFRVLRYIKGHGPANVRVDTAVPSNGVVAEDGIEPQTGESWRIYTNSKHGPYNTNVCLGSRQLRPPPR